MKLYILILSVSLPCLVASVSCPYAELYSTGLLSKDDAAKFEAVKRDPKAADALLKAHKREPSPQSGGLIGPIVGGLLDLPLGGGLCRARLRFQSNSIDLVDSKRCPSALDWDFGCR